MKPFKITNDIWWNGVLYPDVDVLDIIVTTKNGTTFNSYVIKNNKVAVIDTVKSKYADHFVDNVKSIVKPETIDFIIIQQNLSANFDSFLKLIASAPQASVVCSESTGELLKRFFKDLRLLPVYDGMTIDLGGTILQFLLIPFLHRPEVFFIYLPEQCVLFPGDVFASHHCDTRMFDDQVRKFHKEFENYFQTIFRRHKDKMLEAIHRIENLNIEMIAPSFGPILRTQPRSFITAYKTWCQPQDSQKSKLLAIFYASAHGQTERMAERIAQGARAAGVQVIMTNLLENKAQNLTEQVEQADGILFGSPTINRDAVKPIWQILADLATISTQGKVAGSFGSYGWGGEAQALIDERLRNLNFIVPKAGLRVFLIPTEDDLKQCEAFGRSYAEML